MKLIKNFLMILVLLWTTHALADPVEGKEYQLLNPPQPTHSGNKIEVLEFFFYGCSHCYNPVSYTHLTLPTNREV